MTKEEKAMYKEKKPIAVCPMYTFGGVEILEIIDSIDGQYVVALYNDRLHRVRVRYNSQLEPYVIIESMQIPLANFMRV